MRLCPNSNSALPRELALLAPCSSGASGFCQLEVNRSWHATLLEKAQRLRGSVYLEQNAVTPAQLAPGGRHIQEVDDVAWHLLTVERTGEVSGCARFMLHADSASWSDLAISRSALARCETWGGKLRAAVEEELAFARRERLGFVELGGWALKSALRCTTEAARMMLATYALSRWLGGAVGISTANRFCSAPLLRRIGGRAVVASGVELPPYFEPRFNCEVEVLRFDSSNPNPRYGRWIDEVQSSLAAVRIVSA
uniref:Long chain N-acyltyrosine synthase n=1 Tax=uncultured bacterium CSLF43 TaxID=1091575 RepID=Q6XQK8_9BACT|nr:long chain N-acyltyrosine synthase [uncultured bacterium CSLF43]